MPVEDKGSVAVGAISGVRLCRVEGVEALRGLTSWALVQLGIGVPKLDCDVSKFLSEEADRLHRDGR